MGPPTPTSPVSPASLENIPENNYIRYVAYLSSENPQLTGASGPLVHEVTIQTLDAGKGWIYTQDAKDVSWNSAILTARVLYSDPGVVVRFQYRKAGGSWENTPWEGCEGKIYWKRITGLENDTAYEFQAQLYNKAEDMIENGGVRTFRTLHPTPTATPLRVTLVDNGSAVLSARIYYADKDSVTLKFWYGSGESWSSTSPDNCVDHHLQLPHPESFRRRHLRVEGGDCRGELRWGELRHVRLQNLGNGVQRGPGDGLPLRAGTG
jgi:hypothetical protein